MRWFPRTPVHPIPAPAFPRDRSAPGGVAFPPGAGSVDRAFADVSSARASVLSRAHKRLGVMEPGSEDRNFVHLNAPSTPKTEADANTAPLIQKIGAPPSAQIEKLIWGLQEAKNLLESEAGRIQREIVRYVKFAQLASASVKIIFETVSEWRQEGHPMRKFVSSNEGRGPG